MKTLGIKFVALLASLKLLRSTRAFPRQRDVSTVDSPMSVVENPTRMVDNLPSTTEPEDSMLTIEEIMENWARSRHNALEEIPPSAYQTSLGSCVEVHMKPG